MVSVDLSCFRTRIGADGHRAFGPFAIERVEAGVAALYQPAYVVTAPAQSRVQMEAMRSGIAMSLFQASQQASTMFS